QGPPRRRRRGGRPRPSRRQGHHEHRHPDRQRRLPRPRDHPVLQGRRHHAGRPREHRVPLRDLLGIAGDGGTARPLRGVHVPRRRRPRVRAGGGARDRAGAALEGHHARRERVAGGRGQGDGRRPHRGSRRGRRGRGGHRRPARGRGRGGRARARGADAGGGLRPVSRTKRILVVTSGALFVRGGHLAIAEATTAALRSAGYLSEVMVTPQNRFGRQLSAYWANWLTDVGETADGQPVDQVISLRFPSYAVRHWHHVCWLNHRMREYYDLWERFTRGLGRKGRLKEGVRRRVFHALDRRLLTRNVHRLFAQSRTIQARLERFGRIRSEVLYPPPPERPYRTDGYGDYVFAVSRLHPLKRLKLLVEAVPLMKDGRLSVKIAGEGEEATELRAR